VHSYFLNFTHLAFALAITFGKKAEETFHILQKITLTVALRLSASFPTTTSQVRDVGVDSDEISSQNLVCSRTLFIANGS